MSKTVSSNRFVFQHGGASSGDMSSAPDTEHSMSASNTAWSEHVRRTQHQEKAAPCQPGGSRASSASTSMWVAMGASRFKGKLSRGESS